MATVASTPRTNTITLASATAGPFEVGFRLFDTDTLEVYLNGQRTSAWTLSAAFTDGYSDGATITFNAELEAGDVVQIDGALQPRREADYLTGDPGLTRKLNVEMARLWAGLSEVKRKSETSLRTFGPAIPFTPVPGASVGFDDEGNPTSGPLFGEIAGAAAAAQTAVEARDEVVEVAGSIVSADLIERSVVGDGVVASLTFPGTYSLKTNFIDVTIGGVQQSQDAFTLVPSGTNTVLTFPTPIPIGLTARAKATSQLVSEVAEEDQITDLSTKSVADRAAALAWIAAHGAPPVGFRLAWGGVAVRYVGSGTVIADMPGYVPDGRATDAHFGGGAAGLAAAVAYDDATLTASIATTGQINLAANREFTAQRGATVTREVGASGPLFGSASDLRLKDVTLQHDPDTLLASTARVMQFAEARQNITFDGVVSDGATTVDPVSGARNALSAAFILNNGADVDGFTVKDSTFARWFWGILQDNATVAEFKNVSITGSTFDEFGAVMLLFNAPASGALHEDILIMGNRLGSVRSRQPFDSGSPGFPHRGSFAGHVEYTRLIGNHGYGYGGELFRAEEAAKASVWIANTAKLNGKDGIEIIPNNAGGTVYTPTLFAVADNVLVNVGLEAAPALGWGLGLHVYTTVAGLADAECIGESTVHDNISKGWAQALQVHQGAQRNLIHHNVLADSEEGIKTWQPSLGMQDNLISDCAETIVAERGGMIGRFHIRSADAVPDPGVITVVTGQLAAQEWTWETGRHSVPNGSSYYRLVDVGSRIDGRVTVFVIDDLGTRRTVETGRLEWDGTTMFYTQELRVANGNVIVSTSSPWGVDTGDLTVHIFNGSGESRPGVRVQVAFEGLHIWGP